MAWKPKISISQIVENNISIRYDKFPILEFVCLIKSRKPLGNKKQYVIEFFREITPENREKFRIAQKIRKADMDYLYNQVKDIPAIKYLKGKSTYER